MEVAVARQYTNHGLRKLCLRLQLYLNPAFHQLSQNRIAGPSICLDFKLVGVCLRPGPSPIILAPGFIAIFLAEKVEKQLQREIIQEKTISGCKTAVGKVVKSVVGFQ